MSFGKTLLAGLLVAALAACGHSSSTNSKASSQTNGVMSNATASPLDNNGAAVPMGGNDKSGNAMAPGTFATIPPSLQCGAVQPVWANEKTHVYHLPSDPYYGRTKHGEYMCPSTAKAQGYRPAGKHATKSTDENGSGT